jgi:hypothetical protein
MLCYKEANIVLSKQYAICCKHTICHLDEDIPQKKKENT